MPGDTYTKEVVSCKHAQHEMMGNQRPCPALHVCMSCAADAYGQPAHQRRARQSGSNVEVSQGLT